VEPPPGDNSPGGAQPVSEPQSLGVLLTRATPATWRSPARPADFFAAKALADAVLGVYGVVPVLTQPDWSGWDGPDELTTSPAGSRRFLHPVRSATVWSGPQEEGAPSLGWIGEIHPRVLAAWDLDPAMPVAAFELDLTALAALAPESQTFAPIEQFPPVVQDVAVVVEQTVPAAEVEAAVREGGGELLRQIEVFDLYTGDQVGEGNKSLALRLEFRAPDRTLTDEDVAERRTAIEETLAAIGGKLRA
jgi:phenylalanyl-tRNA synthetase beta chain